MFRIKLVFLAIAAFLFINRTFAERKAKIESRIVQGYDAIRGQFPFYVYLEISSQTEYEYKKVECGGSLISNLWIITAAHCLRNNVVAVEVHLGALSLFDVRDIGYKIIYIEPPISISDHVYMHPQFQSLFALK